MAKSKLNIGPTVECLKEAVPFAKGVANHWESGTIKAINNGVWINYPFGNYPNKSINETQEDAQRYVVKRFIEILEGFIVTPKPIIPTSSSLHGGSKPVGSKVFLERVVYEFRSDRIEALTGLVFRWSDCDKLNYDVKCLNEMLINCYNVAGSTLAEYLAVDEPKGEHLEVLNEWRALGVNKTLRHYEVSNLFKKVRGLPLTHKFGTTDPSSSFLYRCCKKLGKPGSHASWMLRSSAKV
jgi:hypothetical protein